MQVVPHDSSGTRFLRPKITAKFELDAKRKWGGLKLATFNGKRAINRKRY